MGFDSESADVLAQHGYSVGNAMERRVGPDLEIERTVQDTPVADVFGPRLSTKIFESTTARR